MTVNFTGASVTSVVNTAAGKGSPTVTFAFAGRDSAGGGESDQSRWKKFFPGNAKLIVDYDSKPGVPTGLQVNGVGCTSAGVAIGVTNPYFSAVLPDADGTKQVLKATWQLYKAPVGGTMVAVTAPGVTSATANTRSTSVRLSGSAVLVNNTRYAFRVYSTDPAPYSISSTASGFCYFTVDTSVPPVTITPVTPPAGPGRPGTFQLTSTATDVSKFTYGWTEATTSTITAGTVTGGKGATVTVTAPKYGITILYARAYDATNNIGYASYEFTVPRPAPAVARWGLERRPGVSEADALADQAPALAGDNQLSVQKVSWTDSSTWVDKGRVVGAQELNWTNKGDMLSTPAVVDTTKSYSVSAWIKLDALGGFQSFLSQDGANVANFQLQYRSDNNAYCFGLRNTDTAATTAYTFACATGLPVAGRWTHLAGGYDAAAKTISVWVDGLTHVEVAAPAVWSATNPFRIGGRKYTATSWLDYVNGSVADVQVFDRVLVANDFSGKTADEEDSGGFDEPGIGSPVHVGRFSFDSMVPCLTAGVAGTCEDRDAGTGFRQRLSLTAGSNQGPGNRGYGLALNNVNDIDENSSQYGQATSEYGIAQRNTAADGQPEQWQDTPVLKTDQSFTVSVWVQPAQLTTTMDAVSQRMTLQSAFYLGVRTTTVNGVTGPRFEAMTANADSADGETYTHVIAPTVLTDDDTTDWFHLVYVYNAASPTTQRLYVNGDLAATGTAKVLASSGALSVGGAWWSPESTYSRYYDPWFGGIDDLDIYQGAFTSGQVDILREEIDPAPLTDPIAQWNLDEGTGTVAADSTTVGWGDPAVAHPATLTNVAWGAGRTAGGNAATFNGTSSYAEAALPFDTTASFTVSAWARVTDLSVDRTILVRSSTTGMASFYLQYNKAKNRWIGQLLSQPTAGYTVWVAASSAPPKIGKWTHLAASYDAEHNRLSLYVDGVANDVVPNVVPFNDPAGLTWIGRSGATWFAGEIADLAVWDRPAGAAEIAGRAAASPELEWQFDEASGTTAIDYSGAGRHGTLAGGATRVTPGHAADDAGAVTFNGTDAVVTAPAAVRTDQSYSVGAWVKVSGSEPTGTVLGQDGAHSAGFSIQWHLPCKCWAFVLPNTDVAAPVLTTVESPAAKLNAWTHVAGVYDANLGRVYLYVDGTAVANVAAPAAPWNATGAFTVGRTRAVDTNTDWFAGSVDGVQAFQGALSAAEVTALLTTQQ